MTIVRLFLTWMAPPLALATACWLTARFLDPRSRWHLLDHPNVRSLHTQPTPRSGGLAILAGIAVGLALVWSTQGPMLFWLAVSVIPLAAISFLDDRFGISIRWRLLVHFAAASVVILAGYGLMSLQLPGLAWTCPVWLCTTATIVFMLWMINLYNFMDGMDGFAGGMAVIGFGTLAIIGMLTGNQGFFLFNLIVAFATAGFLIFNFPPAKIFMGDMGSSSLGFLAAGMGVWADRQGLAPLWVSILVFSPFIFDATVTLIRRLFRGERVWYPHKTHYYQRLVQMGWGHRKTVLAEYVLMLACAISAVIALHTDAAVQWGIIISWLLIYATLMIWVDKRWLGYCQNN